MSTPNTDLAFRGIDGAECARFIRAVKHHARSEGKVNDERWMLEYAQACFTGKALRWLLGLSDEVQSNWKALQLAMMDQYPDDTDDPTIPTPPPAAAAPPPIQHAVPAASIQSTMPTSSVQHTALNIPIHTTTPNFRTGRIRVTGHPSFLGSKFFVSSKLASGGGLYATSNPKDALIVRVPDSNPPYDIELVPLYPNAASKKQWLGLKWYTSKGPGPGSGEVAFMCINTRAGDSVPSSASSDTIGRGLARSQVWEFADDGLQAIWMDQGIPHILTVIKITDGTERVLYFIGDTSASGREPVSDSQFRVKLFFEPTS